MTARVLLLTLGGTIASVPSDAGSGGGAVPSLTGADLVAAVPELSQVADLDVRSLGRGPSGELQCPGRRLAARELADRHPRRIDAADPVDAPRERGQADDQDEHDRGEGEGELRRHHPRVVGRPSGCRAPRG